MKYTATALLLASLFAGSAADAGVQWEVLSSDPGSLEFRVVFDGARLVEGPAGLTKVRVPGAHAGGDPGMPALPADARWVALPPSGSPTWDLVSIQVEEFGNGRLAPVPTPAVAPGEDDGPRLVEQLLFGEGYDSYRLTESEVVSLGTPVHARRQRMVPVAVRPILYDAATGRIRVVRELRVRLQWPSDLASARFPADPDPTVLRTVLNAEQAREWATWSPRHESIRDAARSVARDASVADIAVFDPASLAADAIRLRVNRTGIVRVTAADLMSGGGMPDDLPRSWLRVVQFRASEPGQPEYPAPLLVDVPAHFNGNPDEAVTLQASDEIYFHALRVEDDADTLVAGSRRALPALPWGESSTSDLIPPRYAGDHFNRENVYWVLLMEPPVEGWSRMEAVTLDASSGTPEPHYIRLEHFEGEQGYRDEAFDPWVERYAWNRREAVGVTRTLRLVHPVAGQDLFVRWAAGMHISGSPTPVDFSLRQDTTDHMLLSLNLSDRGVMTGWSAAVQNSPFTTGSIQFRMRRIYLGSEVGVNAFLDHVDLEYPAEFRAYGDVLRFGTGTAAALTDVEVEEFGQASLMCFDVSDPRRPRWIDLGPANVLDRSAGGVTNFTLSLQVPQPDGEKVFEVAPRVRFSRIALSAIERDPLPDVIAAASGLQVVAVGPEFLRSQMDRWIAWREDSFAGSGWNFGYVDVQQIYDHFSGGLQSPWAIRQFMEWQWLNEGAVALVLVGDANEDVLDASGRAGPNLVPPSLHLQSFSGTRELLASDKWFGVFGYEPAGSAAYPQGLQVTSDVLVGRLPAGDEAELATMIDKIIAYESGNPDEEWRRRTLWVADDAYSSDLLGAETGCYRYQSIEVDFLTSQQTSADMVEAALDSTISAVVMDSDEYTRDCRLGVSCEDVVDVRVCFDRSHAADYLDRWSQGWLWLSYQGHANFNVLGHENLMVGGRLSRLRNDGRPFVFFGVGCHVSDFLRAEEGSDGASLGEGLLMLPNAGAIATYGSSGFEFLTPNATFMEVLAEAMFDRRAAESPVFGAGLRNQWLLGDVMARGELETLALSNSINIYKADEMVSQFNLLGDPLLRMDAGAPRMAATRDGIRLPEGGAIDADAGVGFAALDLALVDETGLDRIEITDSEGRDYSGVTPALAGADPRQETVTVHLPVYPQDYTLEIATFDAGRPTLRQTVLGLGVSLGLELLVDGEPVDPGSFHSFETGLTQQVEVALTSPVDLVAADIAVEFPGMTLFGPDVAGSGREWQISFGVAPVEEEEPGALSLVLRGYATELLSADAGASGSAPVVLRHTVFPNPVSNEGRIVAQVEGTVDRARISVYDLAGNEVSSREVPVTASEPDPVSGARIAVAIEARDRRGDELANGTYFYRITVIGPSGSARSDMGRLLVMR